MSSGTPVASPAVDVRARVAPTALALALLPFLSLVWRFDFLCDDAYITFRYARNLARGAGLVYHPGLTPPVEGYSEFLWALLLGLGERLGASPLWLSRLVSVACGVGAVVGGLRLSRAYGPLAQHGAALLLATLTPLAVWSTGGMATMPFACAVTWLFAAVHGAARPAGVRATTLLASLVVLLRADGAWWVALVLGPAILAGLRRGDRTAARRALTAAALAALVFGAHVAWRWSTYHDWLPNTARVKVGFSAWALERGARYVGHALLTFPGIALALGAGLLARGARARGPAYALALGTLAYAVLSGGDFMAFARFLVPALPVTAWLLAGGLQRLDCCRAGRVGAVALAGVAALADLLPAYDLAATPASWRHALSVRYNPLPGGEDGRARSELQQWARMNAQAREWVDLGKALALVAQPGDSIVYGAVGAIGYYSDLVVWDLNGLVTREVALREPLPERRSPGHDKTVPREFFLDRRPTYLDAFWYPGTREALEHDPRVRFDPRFHRVLELPREGNPRPEQLLVVMQLPR